MQAYADALKAAGQRVAYVQVPGAGQRILGLEARLTGDSDVHQVWRVVCGEDESFLRSDFLSGSEAVRYGVGGVDASKLAASQRPSE